MKWAAYICGLILLMTACKTSMQGIGKSAQKESTPVLSESLLQKKENGVDFYAKGNYPSSWSVEMDFGNIIRFKSLDGLEANSSAVQPVSMPEINATSYTSKTTKGEMKIVLFDTPCTDPSSGEKYSKKVEVTINNKRYEGCGQYLFDAAVNGKWMLETINSKLVSSSDFEKGLPELTMDMAKNIASGHDGCNQFNGGFEIMGSKIKFKPFVSTKMACPANKSNTAFTQLLSNQTIDYYFKDGKLLFYLPDDSIISFRK